MICEARAPEYQPVLINSRMRPSAGQPQPPYDYADCNSVPYSQQQQQQQQSQQQHFRSDAGPSIVNTLEAPAYYQPLPNAPKHAPQQQSYYEPSSPAVTISQFSYALDQHKPIAACQHQHQPTRAVGVLQSSRHTQNLLETSRGHGPNVRRLSVP
ncbi:unnamed protein product [Hyaloperonospora brassicae]|uniref:RxLR effector candidate protein n=1 Tax=Hyaloperonospora brassicae TaxID=162125 RepID=A0AAV0TY13_HYABA|nr:unnamed protein product [Hyaloperonospora brassicae]